VPRLHREILDVLLERIVDGRFPPGAMLPKETAIRDEFDVSRGTGREALRALEERRVAVVKHGRGATVQPPVEWNVLDPAVAGALARGRRRRAFLDEVSEFRTTLRVEAAGLAAERAGARERAAIAEAAARLAVAADGGVAAADRGGAGLDPAAAAADVWRLIAGAAGNRPLAATLRTLADIDAASFSADALDAYVRLVAAIDAEEPAAARDAARAAA
jgi:DNA-binding FadR family transcriptional regulator